MSVKWKICKKCNHKVNETAISCPYCNSKSFKKESYKPKTEWKVCKKCGKKYNGAAKTCPYCDSEPSIKWKVCKNCGKRINNVAKTCPYCDSKSFKKYVPNSKPPAKWKICKNCGENVKYDSNVCSYCNSSFLEVKIGNKLPYFSPLMDIDDTDNQWKVCPRCNKKVNIRVFKCPFCHNSVFSEKKYHPVIEKNNTNFVKKVFNFFHPSSDTEEKPNKPIEPKITKSNKKPTYSIPKSNVKPKLAHGKSNHKTSYSIPKSQIKPKINSIFKNYKSETIKLKSKFDLKQQKARQLIDKSFPAPQLTNTKFISVVDECCNQFNQRVDAIEFIIDSADHYSPKLDTEIKANINILKELTNKLDSFIEELIINLSDVKDSDVENLLDEMEYLTKSIKNYE